MTVRMDSRIKQQFDRLCQQFGMSTNTAINIFINQVIRRKAIPFVISAEESGEETIRQRALAAFAQARNEAEKRESDEPTLEEINEEIRLSRLSRP